MEEAKISIVGREDLPDAKGFKNYVVTRGELSESIFEKNLSEFVSKIDSALSKVHSTISEYSLDEVELNIEISVSGSISLLGTIEGSTTGGVTLLFRRRSHD